MKIFAFIRKSAPKNDTDTQATIYFRLRGDGKDIKAASELTINPNHWNPEKPDYKDRVALVSDDEKIKLGNDIRNIVTLITDNYTKEADAELLKEMIDRYHHPERYKTPEQIGRATRRGHKAFRLDIDEVTADTLRDMWDFLRTSINTTNNTPRSTNRFPKSELLCRAERIR